MQPTLYAGTIGQSVWRSNDNGDTWRRASNELFPEADVRAITVNPSNSDILYAGTEKGIFRSDNAAESWHRLSSPMDELEVWAIAIDPRSPNHTLRGNVSVCAFSNPLMVVIIGSNSTLISHRNAKVSRLSRASQPS